MEYFGDQLPPDEDVTTSKACGTVDSLIKIKSKHKLSPEITVEKEESVAASLITFQQPLNKNL